MNHRDVVTSVLANVGAHRSVRFEVTEVVVRAESVEIDLVLHYASATPVCCDEPGCYIGFLGQHRALVPGAIGDALGMPAPAITIRAQLRHEPGYRHVDVRSGALLGEGVDFVATYSPPDFES